MTPGTDNATADALIPAIGSGALPQHVHLLGAPTAWCPRTGGRVGPSKIILADLPDFGALTGQIQDAHDAGRAVAVHCVTREALILLLAPLDETGSLAGDRVEHGAPIPAVLLLWFRSLGLCVVSQPGFLAIRGGDYLRGLPEDRDDLYRARSLLANGVGYALSSETPYGPLDPWTVMAAGVRRYFESREEIYLRLAAEGWREWAGDVAGRLAGPGSMTPDTPEAIADVLTRGLVERPLFCDLLAHAQVSLERGVRLETVRQFKLSAVDAVDQIAEAVHAARGPLDAHAVRDLIAVATSLAGSLWQTAHPEPALKRLYAEDTRLNHSVVDFEPRLQRLLRVTARGLVAEKAGQ